MDLVVLAGGLGTRLRAAVPDLPKPMAPVAGRPFLEHLIDRLAGPEVSRLILSVGYRAGSIRSHFGPRYRDLPVAYVTEEAPLGTGGALLEVLRVASPSTPFAMVNGDTFFPVPLAALRERHEQTGATMTMALRRVPDGSRYSPVRLDAAGALLEFLPRGSVTGEALINGGAYLFGDLGTTAEVFPGVCSLEDQLIPHWLSQGRKIQGVPFELPFLDIGVPEDYARAAAVLQA